MLRPPISFPRQFVALWLVTTAVAVSLLPACDNGGPSSPSRGAVVTFQVADETFRVHLLDERQIDAARQAANGGPARIPNGRVVAGAGVELAPGRRVR